MNAVTKLQIILHKGNIYMPAGKGGDPDIYRIPELFGRVNQNGWKKKHQILHLLKKLILF
jgi:hypothetical protein